MSRRVRVAVLILGLVASVSLITGTATAKQVAHYTIFDHQDIVVDWCGEDAPFRNVFTVRGVVTDRATGPNGAVREARVSHGEAVWTNLATEKSIRLTWNENAQDNHVTVNPDGTLSILFQDSGSAKIYGPDGHLVGNAPGMLRTLVIIDYGGTLYDFSDDTFISETLLVNHGPQPSEGECDFYLRLTS